MDGQKIQLDFGDDDLLGRTMRTIIMIADGAITKLTDLGWKRKSVNMQINQDNPLPCWIILNNKRVFEIRADQAPGVVSIIGEWLKEPEAPGIIDKFWGR